MMRDVFHGVAAERQRLLLGDERRGEPRRDDEHGAAVVDARERDQLGAHAPSR